MTSIKLTLALAVALAVLAGCSSDEAPADTTTPVAQPAAPVVDPLAEPPPTPEPGEVPVEVRADAIAAGHVLGANGAVSESKPGAVYGSGDTIHASAPTRGQKPGADVSVYWTYQDGTTHKEEMKTLGAGEQYVNFSFAKADGMRPGKYNVQIDFDFKPVGIVDFQVK